MEWTLGPWHQLFYSMVLLKTAHAEAEVFPGTIHGAWMTKPNLQVLLGGRISAICKGHSGGLWRYPPSWSAANSNLVNYEFVESWRALRTEKLLLVSNLNFPSCNVLSLPLFYWLTLPERPRFHHLYKCLRSSCRLRLGPPDTLHQKKQAQIPQSALASDRVSSLSRSGVPRAGRSTPQCEGEEGNNFLREKWGEREWGHIPPNICLICRVQIGYVKTVHFIFRVSPWVACPQSNRKLVMEQGLD